MSACIILYISNWKSVYCEEQSAGFTSALYEKCVQLYALTRTTVGNLFFT